MKPGGWIELVDITCEAFSDDDTIKDAPYVVEWAKLLEEASNKFGKNINLPTRYKELMQSAGFQNVREDAYKVCLQLPYSNLPRPLAQTNIRLAPA